MIGLHAGRVSLFIPAPFSLCVASSFDPADESPVYKLRQLVFDYLLAGSPVRLVFICTLFVLCFSTLSEWANKTRRV